MSREEIRRGSADYVRDRWRMMRTSIRGETAQFNAMRMNRPRHHKRLISSDIAAGAMLIFNSILIPAAMA